LEYGSPVCKKKFQQMFALLKRARYFPGTMKERLPCGCLGECDPFAHDTHPDGPGKPAGPGRDDELEMLAKRLLRLHRKARTNGIDIAIRQTGVELAELILGDDE
jgi:hypothetical protein